MIRSRQNRHLKDIRRLRRCKDELAVLEGPHLLHEAVVVGGRQPIFTIATPAFLDEPRHRDLLAALEVPPLAVLPQLMREVCDADSPRGIVGVLPLPRVGIEALPHPSRGVYLYLDGMQDPGNLGALARVAEASGVEAMALAPDSVSPNHPRALRASAGSLLRLPTAVGITAAALRHHLAPIAPRWLALAADGGTDLYRAELEPPVVLLLGAEGRGLSKAALDLADERIAIPMQGAVESLNVTVAAALVLFEIRRAT